MFASKVDVCLESRNVISLSDPIILSSINVSTGVIGVPTPKTLVVTLTIESNQ